MMRGVSFTEGYNVDTTRAIRWVVPEAALAAVGSIRRFQHRQQLFSSKCSSEK
jgi:hypothetical protein